MSVNHIQNASARGQGASQQVQSSQDGALYPTVRSGGMNLRARQNVLLNRSFQVQYFNASTLPNTAIVSPGLPMSDWSRPIHFRHCIYDSLLTTIPVPILNIPPMMRCSGLTVSKPTPKMVPSYSNAFPLTTCSFRMPNSRPIPITVSGRLSRVVPLSETLLLLTLRRILSMCR